MNSWFFENSYKTLLSYVHSYRLIRLNSNKIVDTFLKCIYYEYSNNIVNDIVDLNSRMSF